MEWRRSREIKSLLGKRGPEAVAITTQRSVFPSLSTVGNIPPQSCDPAGRGGHDPGCNVVCLFLRDVVPRHDSTGLPGPHRQRMETVR